MENRDIILQELKEISPVVANLTNRNLNFVPQGYFDGLADEILLKAQGFQIPKVTDPYQAPEGYFDDLAESILQNIQIKQKKNQDHTEVVNELELTAPLLNSISRENPYSIPDNYFSGFNIKISGSIPVVKIVSLAGRTNKWIMYSAAACITAILLSGGYLLLNKTDNYRQQELAGKLEEVRRLNVERGISALSDSDIKNYLNSQNGSFSDIFLNTLEEYPDVDQLLDNTSDEEINQYLNDNKEPQTGKKNIKEI